MSDLLRIDEALIGPHKRGFVLVVNGAQHGDEGKGKVIDLVLKELGAFMTEHPGITVTVARFNGSHNAGHTIKQGDQEVILHIIPSGVFHPGVQPHIGAGVLVNPVKLLQEMSSLKKVGLSVDDRLTIDPRATVILPHELWLDRLTGKKTGSTGNGVGPAVMDKAIRQIDGEWTSLTFAEALENLPKTREIMLRNFQIGQTRYRDLLEKYGEDARLHLSEEEMQGQVDHSLQSLEIIRDRGLVQTDSFYLDRTLQEGGIVLAETAQGTMLDPLYGDRPFNTSTHTLPQYVTVGGGVSPMDIKAIVSAIKVPPSRVGEGAFMSEIGGPEAEIYRTVVSEQPIHPEKFSLYLQKLRPFLSEKGQSGPFLEEFFRAHKEGPERVSVQDFEKELDLERLFESRDPFLMEIGVRILLGEYGATTGRPRGVGMIDLCQLAYALRISSTTHLLLNRLDKIPELAKYLGGIPFVNAYEDRTTGARTTAYPDTDTKRRNMQPVVDWFHIPPEQLTGEVEGVAREQLPAGLGVFLEEFKSRLAQLLGREIPIACIGTGKKSSDLAVVEGIHLTA